MTLDEMYAVQQEVAGLDILIGPVGYVKEVIRRVMDATGRFHHITAAYTSRERFGQEYSDGWKLHNANALTPEADRKRAPNPDREDLLTVWSNSRNGWRTIRVDSITSFRVHTAAGVAVDVPVFATHSH